MTKHIHENTSFQNTDTKAPQTVSVRKMYLNKRAEIIKQNLKDSENISVFVSDILSQDFNATKDEQLFARSLLWMRDHLHTNASIKELAQFLNVSVRKVQRLFSYFSDESYTNVLLEMRMSEAKNYLKRMENSVGEVAYLVGIKDHAYFTYLFRRSTGQTPSEFRQSLMSSELSDH